MKAQLITASLAGAVLVLYAGSARAADFDIDHLPPIDPQMLSSSIGTWDAATILPNSIDSWTVRPW